MAAQYNSDRRAYQTAKDQDWSQMRGRHTSERDEQRTAQSIERKRFLGQNWKGRGEERKLFSSYLAATQARARAELRERQRLERDQIRQARPPFPDMKTWLQIQGLGQEREEFRTRMQTIGQIHGDGYAAPLVRDIRSFEAKGHDNGVVVYTRPKQNVGFTDFGHRVEVDGWKDQDTCLAALQLAQAKWGRVTLTGPDEYKQQCIKLAAMHGIGIANEELQTQLAQERERLAQVRAEAMKTKQAVEFQKFHTALNADTYRLTAVKFFEDGTKRGFIPDKRVDGFTPEEYVTRIPEFKKMHARSENINLTPLAKDKHFILVDDMTKEGFERLVKDGHKPAVLVETSPRNYQATLVIPKLGTPHDKDVANALTVQLNREYGDPKLTGGVHPQRAPAFENQKPKHKREDGSFPEIKLLGSANRTCDKALEMAKEINAEREREAQEKAEARRLQQERAAAKAAEARARGEVPMTNLHHDRETLARVYQAHHADVIARQKAGAVIDASRVDAMIATRMRCTGFDQSAIRDAIRDNCESVRTADEAQKHNWDRYADRAAEFAFRAEGDRQLAKVQHYADHWRKLEGRPTRAEEEYQQRHGAHGRPRAGQEPQDGARTPERGADGPELPENSLDRAAQERAEAERQEQERQRSRSSGPELG